MHLSLLVALALLGVVLVTDSAPVVNEEFDNDRDLPKSVADEIIHEDRAAFLNTHQDFLKTISLADIEESEFTSDITDAAGPVDADHEPADETPSEGAFQADMMLTDEQKAELIGPDDDDENDDGNQSSRRSRRKAITATSKHWPYGIIPVEFSVTATKKSNAITAMLEWMDHTCLRFVYYNPENEEYLGHNVRLNIVGDRSGCWSYVGKALSSGRQTVSIGDGCERVGTIIHELGHAIGFHHEQSRPDRDESITVHYGNIQSGMEHNFKKYNWEQLAAHGVSYDVESIMHYGPYGFSRNGSPTITTKDPSDQSRIGQRNGLAHSDIQLANNMYNCPGR